MVRDLKTSPEGNSNEEDPKVSLDEIMNQTKEVIEGKPKIPETEATIVDVGIRYYQTKTGKKAPYKPTAIIITTEYDFNGETVRSEDAYGGLNSFLDESGTPNALGNVMEGSETYFAHLARQILGLNGTPELTQKQVLEVISKLKEFANQKRKVMIKTETVQFGKKDPKNKQVIQKFL